MALTQVSTGGIKDGQVHTADLADAQITAGKLHADALDHTYTLGADGSNHYTFTGEGLTGAVNDPTLYLTRGKTYRFVNGNSSGAHPFRIQTTVNGSAGTEYNTGVTNNGGAGGSTIVFEVPHAAPNVLYYQCTSHGSMGGIFYVTGALADGTVTTAKLADDAVTDAKLANSINSAIAANTAKTSLEDDSVSTAKIQDDAVTADKLANSINTAIAANTAKDLTALSASNLTSGTVPDARFPATLPAVSGANLTNLPASGKATNLVINGAMQVAQRGTSSTSTGFRTCDRWQVGGNYNGTNTQSQADVGYTTAPYDKGFRKSLKVTNGNHSSANAGDNIEITYSFEGQEIATSGWDYVSSSKKITLSFWVKSSVAQTFYGYFRTFPGVDMKYSFPIVCSTTGWEYKTVSIVGESNFAENAQNSFPNNNSRAMVLRIVPFYGTNYTDAGSVSNAWQNYSSGVITPVYDTSWFLTNGATFELTGVQLEVGDSASDFAHESFTETLLKCKRYCHVVAAQEYTPLGIGFQYYSGNIFITYGPIDMRTTPTMVAKSGSSGGYVYEKVFSNSAQYHHQISLDSKTKKDHAMFIMSGDNTRAGEAVRTAVHAFSLQNNEPFVYLDAEL